MKCQSCGTPIDLTVIPDKELQAECGRRNVAKHKTRAGAVIWGKHITKANCRCLECTLRRAKERAG